jgi:hypothetical protein
MPNSWWSRMIRSQALQRTTPSIAGIGPSSTRPARNALCSPVSLPGAPGDELSMRPSGPLAVHAAELALESGVQIIRRYCRPLLLCLKHAHRSALEGVPSPAAIGQAWVIQCEDWYKNVLTSGQPIAALGSSTPPAMTGRRRTGSDTRPRLRLSRPSLGSYRPELPGCVPLIQFCERRNSSLAGTTADLRTEARSPVVENDGAIPPPHRHIAAGVAQKKSPLRACRRPKRRAESRDDQMLGAEPRLALVETITPFISHQPHRRVAAGVAPSIIARPASKSWVGGLQGCVNGVPAS